jgi:hypothetical protein
MVWEVIPLLYADTIILEGETMKVSPRLKTYRKGVTCVCCGIEGQYFIKMKYDDQRPHLNLFAIDENGREMMMTSDHIIPKSKGGSNRLNNRQPMCSRCNTVKGNKLLGEIK